jgi:hypothetical protein
VILKDNASSGRMAAFYRGAADCEQQGGSIHLRSLRFLLHFYKKVEKIKPMLPHRKSLSPT